MKKKKEIEKKIDIPRVDDPAEIIGMVKEKAKATDYWNTSKTIATPVKEHQYVASTIPFSQDSSPFYFNNLYDMNYS